MMLDFDDYQSAASKTAIYPDAGRGSSLALAYTSLGLAGEAGEVANKVKKVLRDGMPMSELRDILAKELGDVMWYVARLASEAGISLTEVIEQNVAKLADRQSRGVLGGSGDNR